MNEIDLRFGSAVELGRQIQSGRVSSVQVTRLYLDSLEKRGRELNALAELTAELAMRQAARADAEIRAGRIRSPLHGVPWGAKDLLATRGIPTRWGSPAHRDQVFDHDAAVVERLHNAGCVMVAKLAMIELAGGGGYDDCGASLTGACKCPFDESRWAGGSSSGSGAAVGAGSAGFAIGTETWGSITVPAAFCNVSGLRPTFDRVPRAGAMALCFSMDKIGPMARSAEDCAAIFSIIADPAHPRTRDGMFRLGILSHDYAHAEPAKTRFDDALGMFNKLGCQIGEATLPDFPYAVAAETIVNVEGAAAFEELIRSERLHELVDIDQQAGLLAGLAVPGVDYLRALRIRSLAGPEAVTVFDQFDALIAPTLLQVAPLIDTPLSETWKHMGGNGAAGNLLGWPSISIPMGGGENDLPLGLEIIGAPYEDETILAIAMAFQRETDHHKQRPKN